MTNQKLYEFAFPECILGSFDQAVLVEMANNESLNPDASKQLANIILSHACGGINLFLIRIWGCPSVPWPSVL